MNKQVFLEELQTRIRVLAEAEQQDIMEEYSQHIDLKTDKGLSEEAAIADFGNLDALTTEILEAYHVNPAFAEQMPSAKNAKSKNTKSNSQNPTVRHSILHFNPMPAFKRFVSALAELGLRIGGELHRITTTGWKRFGDFWKRPLHKEKKDYKENKEYMEKVKKPRKVEKPKKDKNLQKVQEEHYIMNKKSIFHQFGAGIKRFFLAIFRFCLMVLRLAWNCALVIIACPVAIMTIVLLSCTGTLIVLQAQGYPALGMMLCCMGGVLCGGAILVLGSGLRYRRKKPQTANVKPIAQSQQMSVEFVQAVEAPVEVAPDVETPVVEVTQSASIDSVEIDLEVSHG